MFKVKHLITGEIRTVYAVHGIMFLFYDETGWASDYIDRYEPVEVE